MDLAAQVLKTIRKQESLRAGDRVAVAVSGGADSVALLCLLLELRGELRIVLSVAHVNHKLRGKESDEDERFVAELARQHGLELHVQIAPVRGTHNATSDSVIGSGVESAARDLRYAFFRQLAHENRVSKIATAHTLDDQAETVLLRIFRGTGIRGLRGIRPQITFEERGHVFGMVVRPLLGFRRAVLQEFLRDRGQGWREDSSNQDTAFLRNRVRHRLLPIIAEEFGKAAIEHMNELAEIARAEEEHWESGHPELRAQIAREQASQAQIRGAAETRQATSLQVGLLLALPLAAQRRLVRAWLESSAPKLSISFRLIEQALELASEPAGKTVGLPSGYRIRRTRDHLCLCFDQSGSELRESEYEYPLHIPGEVEIPELGILLRAIIVDPKNVPEAEQDSLLNTESLSQPLLVRNWQAGDRYWPAHTKQEKKVKDLLSDRHAIGAEKKMWPVALGQGGLVWMRGFPVPAAVRPPAAAEKAIWIREIVLA